MLWLLNSLFKLQVIFAHLEKCRLKIIWLFKHITWLTLFYVKLSCNLRLTLWYLLNII